jgi:hypothetical protein
VTGSKPARLPGPGRYRDVEAPGTERPSTRKPGLLLQVGSASSRPGSGANARDDPALTCDGPGGATGRRFRCSVCPREPRLTLTMTPIRNGTGPPSLPGTAAATPVRGRPARLRAVHRIGATALVEVEEVCPAAGRAARPLSPIARRHDAPPTQIVGQELVAQERRTQLTPAHLADTSPVRTRGASVAAVPATRIAAARQRHPTTLTPATTSHASSMRPAASAPPPDHPHTPREQG